MTNETLIHNENATSIAAILEYIQLPNHPLYGQAKEMADKFIEAERVAGIERSRQMMRDQMEHISQEEWAAIVD